MSKETDQLNKKINQLEEKLSLLTKRVLPWIMEREEETFVKEKDCILISCDASHSPEKQIGSIGCVIRTQQGIRTIGKVVNAKMEGKDINFFETLAIQQALESIAFDPAMSSVRYIIVRTDSNKAIELLNDTYDKEYPQKELLLELTETIKAQAHEYGQFSSNWGVVVIYQHHPRCSTHDLIIADSIASKALKG
jgi:ribonuclease HI